MWPWKRRPKVLELAAPVLEVDNLCPWAPRSCAEARCKAWSDGACCLLAGHKATAEVQRRRLHNAEVRRGHH